jgi:hypothetical protein
VLKVGEPFHPLSVLQVVAEKKAATELRVEVRRVKPLRYSLLFGDEDHCRLREGVPVNE